MVKTTSKAILGSKNGRSHCPREKERDTKMKLDFYGRRQEFFTIFGNGFLRGIAICISCGSGVYL